jgi:predicted metal-dependent hydrolase
VTGRPVVEVEVRHSPRSRRWRLEVPWGEPARLTVPRWTSRAEIERVLEEKRPWLEAQRRAQVPRLGLERCAVSESEARVAARELTSALAEEEAERVGVEYARIRIGGQRTLWGSCSAPRHALLQLAARPGALRGARLRRRARALPPAGAQPFAPLLGARRAAPTRLARRTKLAA